MKINWKYISKGEIPIKDTPVICLFPGTENDYALCIYAYKQWFSQPGNVCWSDIFDQWTYLPDEFYNRQNVCSYYIVDNGISYCYKIKDRKCCCCNGNQKNCDYY